MVDLASVVVEVAVVVAAVAAVAVVVAIIIVIIMVVVEPAMATLLESGESLIKARQSEMLMELLMQLAGLVGGIKARKHILQVPMLSPRERLCSLV